MTLIFIRKPDVIMKLHKYFFFNICFKKKKNVFFLANFKKKVPFGTPCTLISRHSTRPSKAGALFKMYTFDIFDARYRVTISEKSEHKITSLPIILRITQ